ncbi:hypothetical protein GQ55_1G269900 [Panicum hallii var. hallii]|uniref:Uncharacterized protein n=1 Tax=Panicum hallii var. hallii TaxID=1504633 RepID=A0A2T7F7X6_9POAL|nr:hypothetical protein GQ55_1G269900 [Panicum hallii var. hallii]
MEQDTPTLKPEWLQKDRAAGAANIWATASSRSDYHQGTGGSSRNHSSGHDRDPSSRQSSSRRSSGLNGSRRPERDAMGKSRGYANFGRNRDKDRERDSDSHDRESRSTIADRHDFKSFGTCRSERDRMNRARSKADTWSKGVVNMNNGSASRNTAVSSSTSNDKSNTIASTGTVVNSISNAAVGTSISNAAVGTSVTNASVSNVLSNGSNASSITFEREFPQLSLDDKNGRQGISKVPSPGISTPIQNVPLITPSDGWNSVLADLPLSSDVKKSPATSSILQIAPSKQTEVMPNNGTALSMAETVMQAPPRISSGPQLSIEAQKIEERTLRQYTLRPLTPPATKSSVLSSLKTKGTRLGDPTGSSKTVQQLKAQSANSSIRAPVKADISKLSQSGSFQVLSREQNGTAHTGKDCLIKPVSPPSTPLVAMDTQKKPVVSQKLKIGINERPLPLQGPCGDRKSNVRDKHRFFEALRTKSSNGSSIALESESQPSPSSLVDVKQDSSLSLGNDFSLFHSETKCTEHGKCFCEEANSSEGSQRHLSDTEENIPSLKPTVADGISQQLLEQSREADLSSEPADTGDEGFQSSLSDSAEGSMSSTPADSDDGWNRSQSGNEEASSLSEVTEPGDEDHPADISPEDKRFMILLGWREDEIVQVEPLDFNEIADTVKGCEKLKKKLQSMESNDNIKSILHLINGQS